MTVSTAQPALPLPSPGPVPQDPARDRTAPPATPPGPAALPLTTGQLITRFAAQLSDQLSTVRPPRTGPPPPTVPPG
ncbi:hypothetical protein OHB04_28625 [Streptomyces sp. NBC_01775]|uniref:hypothetical protein n=1 Tax=Streptomyces sp. NBC_01775 TaxID=2975939 RepID=UPI002DD93510|nr:hypothetical protein [Streptomyces sp. NBC_01775]WSB79313.1 hypothetical protein OHB04_28625 [Streptomyces sp. NBC_01775]